MTVSIASPLKAIKTEVYRMMGISELAKNPTKEVKKVYPQYDLRKRDSWELILVFEGCHELATDMDRRHMEVQASIQGLKEATSGLEVAANRVALDMASDTNYQSTFWGWLELANVEAGVRFESVIVPGPRNTAENDG